MPSDISALHGTDAAYREKYGKIIGVDEAGRGPLAGPVTAAAVMFAPDKHHDLIRDSKKLSEKQREIAYAWITDNAEKWSVYTLGVQSINKMNILRAALKAMEEAVSRLEEPAAGVLVDGDHIPDALQGRADALTGGDRSSFCIAAASILAKVSRDRIMRRWAEIFPEYGFDKHKGYGTPEHIRALDTCYPCPIHRRYFDPVKHFRFPHRPGEKQLGRWGENWAIYYLILKGYRFVTRNYYGGNSGEIDIIMYDGEQYIMIEVKTSFDKDMYDMAERITDAKIEKMMLAAERYFYDLNISEYHVRFDAVIVSGNNWFTPHIEHFENIIG
ncbi:MAG: ribonuclease HII [FCB group bacterium]|nr:ribonuclease HII [FCB group bacterium]